MVITPPDHDTDYFLCFSPYMVAFAQICGSILLGYIVNVPTKVPMCVHVCACMSELTMASHSILEA